MEYRSKSPVCCDDELLPLPACPCILAIAVRGEVTRFLRPCNVEEDDVGDPACDARDSTSPIEFDCHPLFTFTIAYERRVLNSAEI